MIDMLSKILKDKFKKGGIRIEIHAGGDKKDDDKATDLAPEVKDAGGEQDYAEDKQASAPGEDMDFLKSMTEGDPQVPDRKPTFNEKAKGKMHAKMASMKSKK